MVMPVGAVCGGGPWRVRFGVWVRRGHSESPAPRPPSLPPPSPPRSGLINTPAIVYIAAAERQILLRVIDAYGKLVTRALQRCGKLKGEGSGIRGQGSGVRGRVF